MFGSSGAVGQLGQPEIQHARLTLLVHQDIARLQVAMDDAM